MILVDTSAWIEYDRATGSSVDRALESLIASDAPIAATEPVLMEMLGGARDDQVAAQIRRFLTSFEWLPADSAADFEAAARVYRSCRAAGVIPGGFIDCMIAAIAIRTDSELLTADDGFERMARVLPLRLTSTAT
ncbi:MAG: PIN domain nuclease [Actinomycetota bacterium]